MSEQFIGLCGHALPGNHYREPALAPLGVGHAEHRALRHTRVREQRFFDLARIHVRAARDVHVRRPPRDVQKALRIHMAEVAGVEPVVLERLGIGVRIVVIPHEDGRAAHADFSRREGRLTLALLVENRHFHAGARQPAGADARIGCIVVFAVQPRRQNRDVARHLAQPVVLHQHAAQLVQRVLLIGAVHRRTGVDHELQRTMVVPVDGRIFDEHLDDGRHREHVVHAMALDRLPDLPGVHLLAGQQHARRTPCGVDDGVNARAVRERGHDHRAAAVSDAGHQIREMVGDDERHLPVREHPRFRMPGRARRIEEPQGIFVVDFRFIAGRTRVLRHQRLVVQFACARRAERNHMTQRGRSRPYGVDMAFEPCVVNHRARAARLPQIRGLRGGNAKVRRHPDRAETKGDPRALENRQVVARVHQQLVAAAHAELAQGVDGGVHTGVDLAPCGDAVADDHTGFVRMTAGDIGQQAAEVHDLLEHV